MLVNYLKVAIKVLLRRKFYTAVNLLGVAFTLLVLILAAALADNYIAPGSPETRLDRILAIERARLSGTDLVSLGDPGYRLLDSYARDLPGAERFSIRTTGRSVASFLDGEKITSDLARADAAFWEILDFDFVEGAPFTEADEAGGNFVAVINETTRRRFFGGPPAVGKTIRADGQVFTVVGVVKDVSITRPLAYAEIWVPLGTSKSTTYKETLRGGFRGIVLAQSREAMPTIREELKRRLDAAVLPDPDQFDTLQAGAYTRLEELASEFASNESIETPPTAQVVLVMMLLAVGFMILPALNLINLSLSRILERASEIGVRKAFGASSRALVTQFLVENMVLTLVGGACGLVLAAVCLRMINASEFLPYAELTVSYRVFLAGLALSIVFAMMAGALPAWRMSRLHPVEALHGKVR